MTVLPTRLAELTASEINLWCVLLISPEWRIEKRRRPPPSNSYPGGLMAVGATIAAMMKATGWQYAALLPGVLLQSCRATAATQDAPSHSQRPCRAASLE
jgi:hypothetical protein